MAKRLPLLFSFFFFAILFSSTASAQGDLMVMPKRLVFDGSERSQEINLANTGSDTATYAISFIQYKMTENGNFEEVTTPEEGQRFASDFLRYFPRRVSLAPNEAQTVRVQLTRTGNLERGEYRSHVYFRAVEKQTALGAEKAEEAEGISIQINTVFGISIPVIIRHGEATTQMSITDLQLELEEGAPKLSMVLGRSGNMSVYGDIQVDHISPEGVVTPVGVVKGLSVYTPNTLRYFTMPLSPPEGVDLNKGKLWVSFIAGADGTLATTKLELGQ